LVGLSVSNPRTDVANTSNELWLIVDCGDGRRLGIVLRTLHPEPCYCIA
jgi:hypothetical protein